MWSDFDVKLTGLEKGKRLRLIVRFRSVQALLKLYKQVRDKGAFALPLRASRPSDVSLPVLFRTQRKGEEFPATIVVWQEGGVVLEPKIAIEDFKELTSALVSQLSSETSQFVAVSQPETSPKRQAPPTKREPSDDRAEHRPKQFAAREPSQHRQKSATPHASAAVSLEAGRVTNGDEASGQAPERPLSGIYPVGQTTPTAGRKLRDTGQGGWGFRPSDPSVFAAGSGGFSKVGVGNPRGAFRFLDNLELSPDAIDTGEGTGKEALTCLQRSRIEGKQVVLIADCPSEGLRWYFFTEGTRVLSAYLTPPSIQTSLCVLLARQGLLSAESADRALQDAASRGVPEEIAIETMGEISPDMLVKASAARAKLLGERLRVQRGVLFKVYIVRKPIKFRPKAAVAKTGQFRRSLSKFERMSWAEIDELQESRLSSYPSYTGDSGQLRGKLGLDEKGRQFVTNCLNGRYSVRDLPKVSILSRPKTLAMLFALHDAGLIKWERRERTVTQQHKTADLIEEQSEKIGAVDDFEFLGVHWTATGPEVEDAVARIRSDFNPNNLPKLSDDTTRQTREIIAEAERIKRDLSTVEARRRYRTNILEPFAVEQACELILSNFDMAMYRDQQAELKKLMARLIELAPQAALEARERLRTGQRGKPRKKT